jgi:hypothetical protein
MQTQPRKKQKKKETPASQRAKQPIDSFVSQDNEIHLPPKEERN